MIRKVTFLHEFGKTNYAWDANCDGIEITEEDVDYLMKAIDLALHRIKQKNKEKYTLKKYK